MKEHMTLVNLHTIERDKRQHNRSDLREARNSHQSIRKEAKECQVDRFLTILQLSWEDRLGVEEEATTMVLEDTNTEK